MPRFGRSQASTGFLGILPCLAIACALCLACAANAAPNANEKGFQYRNYDAFTAELQELSALYPETIRLSVAQEEYGLPYPQELTCGANDDPCQQLIVHLTNHSTLADDPQRPEVFISGAVHGDEIVGPLTTLELIGFIAKSVDVYLHPDSPAVSNSSTQASQVRNTQKWLYELVNTRNVIITPMTNAYGYSHQVREEYGVDPNRDFNYMRSGPDCMKTMTARVVNEIWRDHIFQLGITFHGGTRALTYEWGSPNHYIDQKRGTSEKSPDDTAQFQLANILQIYAKPFANGHMYPVGTMNEVVYGVTGGMEDWGYAASWENQAVDNDPDQSPISPCNPRTYGGYPPEKTTYNGATHRAFNMLVETSFYKGPRENALGDRSSLVEADLDFFDYKDDTSGVGHVPQNVRLALMYIDMVQPYVRWVDVSLASSTDVSTSDNFVSASEFIPDEKDLLSQLECGQSFDDTQVFTCTSTDCTFEYAKNKATKVQLAWEVLGALSIDDTYIEVASDPEFTDILMQSDGQMGLSRRAFELSFMPGGADANFERNIDTYGTSLFSACIDVSDLQTESLSIRATTVVDQEWASQKSGEDAPSPPVAPQSHIVNARTNANWSYENNGHEVQGSKFWHSPTISLSTKQTGSIDRSTNATNITKVEVGDEGTFVADDASTLTSASSKNELEVLLTEAPEVTALYSDVTVEIVDSSLADEVEEMTGAPATSPSGLPTYPPSTRPATTPPTAPYTGVTKESTWASASLVSDASSDATSASTASGGEAATAEANTNLGVIHPVSEGPNASSSLLQVGYVVIGVGGVVIAVTLAVLYQRVFRVRQSYMHVENRPNTSRSPFDRV